MENTCEFVLGEQLQIMTTTDVLDIDLAKTAILVIDMQNAFIRDGGYFDVIGIDTQRINSIVPVCKKMIDAARVMGIKIVFLKMTESPQLPPEACETSPRLKKRATRLSSATPRLDKNFYYKESWGHQIIDELQPQPQDIIIEKHRHDGFIDTALHPTLAAHNVNTLLFIGIATNICVESTLRHAFFLDYYAIIVSDAVSPMGGNMLQAATLANVQSTFGWVVHSSELISCFHKATNRRKPAPSP